MPCLLVLICLSLPRLAMLFIYMLTNWFSKSFDSILWPLLGFFFMPYTTLAWMAAMMNNHRACTGWWTVLVVVAVLVDIGVIGGSKSSSK